MNMKFEEYNGVCQISPGDSWDSDDDSDDSGDSDDSDDDSY